MKVCTALLLPSLLCYLLPIGRTLAHCSLAFCQSWFLTPASALPLFLLHCNAASLLSHLCLSEFPISTLCVCVVLQACLFYRFCCFYASCIFFLVFLPPSVSDMWECFCDIQISTQAMNLTPTSLQDHRCVHAGIVTAAPIFAAV